MDGQLFASWSVCDESPRIIKDAVGRTIGSACGYSGSGFFPPDEDAPKNARLMAAAPELLEACKAAIRLIQFGQVYEQLSEAIKKAESAQ